KKAPVKKAATKKAVTKQAAQKATGRKSANKPAPGTKKVAVTRAASKPAPKKRAAQPSASKASPSRQADATTTGERSTAATKRVTAPSQPAAPRQPAPLKQRFQLEFYLNASVASLYEHISTPSGFSKWFCDDLNVMDKMYTFQWGEETEVAECLSDKFGEYIRFRWLEEIEEDPGAFFELRIRIDGMTTETCLVVTDHAWPRDLEEEQALWESQIQTLTRVLGA